MFPRSIHQKNASFDEFELFFTQIHQKSGHNREKVLKSGHFHGFETGNTDKGGPCPRYYFNASIRKT
jgi:hypothetical protein